MQFPLAHYLNRQQFLIQLAVRETELADEAICVNCIRIRVVEKFDCPDGCSYLSVYYLGVLSRYRRLIPAKRNKLQLAVNVLFLVKVNAIVITAGR